MIGKKTVGEWERTRKEGGLGIGVALRLSLRVCDDTITRNYPERCAAAAAASVVYVCGCSMGTPRISTLLLLLFLFFRVSVCMCILSLAAWRPGFHLANEYKVFLPPPSPPPFLSLSLSLIRECARLITRCAAPLQLREKCALARCFAEREGVQRHRHSRHHLPFLSSFYTKKAHT